MPPFATLDPLVDPEKFITNSRLVKPADVQNLLDAWYLNKAAPGLDLTQALAFPVFGHAEGVVRYHMVAPRDKGPYILFDEGPGRNPVKWKYASFVRRLQTNSSRGIVMVTVPQEITEDLRRIMHAHQPRFYALIAAAQLNKAVDAFDPFDL